MLTVTPGITAPCSSTALMRMLPVWTCASAGDEIATASATRLRICLMNPPECVETLSKDEAARMAFCRRVSNRLTVVRMSWIIRAGDCHEAGYLRHSPSSRPQAATRRPSRFRRMYPVDRAADRHQAPVESIQRSEQLCFAAKPRERFWMLQERIGQDLQRDDAAEPGVAGTIDLAHAACADEGEDFVSADTRSCREPLGMWNRATDPN